jgi:hypothetical protein
MCGFFVRFSNRSFNAVQQLALHFQLSFMKDSFCITLTNIKFQASKSKEIIASSCHMGDRKRCSTHVLGSQPSMIFEGDFPS